MIGTTLAHFRITAKLGQGGMGEVYRAEDTKLGRQVAIKVLGEAFVRDPDRLARFEREAQLLAALDHPNIAAIYEVGEDDGVHFLAMQLAEGEDLAHRLERGAMPLAEALPLALQIAEALVAAHAKGIVHRDLKPANVMVDGAGRAKLLDFGLAKAWEDDAAEGAGESAALPMPPTLTAQRTQAGVILGTAAYMSPEQAEGKPVDARADVFAFGCVVYEMLAGESAFAGTSVADTLSRVLRDAPPRLVDRLPGMPPELGWVLEKCLAKDAGNRYQDTRDLVVDLRRVPETASDEEIVVAPRGSRSWKAAAVAAAAALAGLAIGLGVAREGADEPRAPSRHFEILTNDVAPMAAAGGHMVAISRDGTRVAYIDESQLMVRDLVTTEVFAVPDSSLGVSPVFSPDGEWLFYTTSTTGNSARAWLEGGRSFPICSASALNGGVWGEDDRIVFSDGISLWTAAADSGECRRLAEEGRAEGTAYASVQVLPGGDELLVDLQATSASPGPAGRAPDAPSSAAIVSAATGEVVEVIARDAADPRYFEGRDGAAYLAFRRGGTIFGQRYDRARRATRGEPVPLIDEVAYGRRAYLDISEEGTLVYVSERSKGEAELVWVDRQGREEPLGLPPAPYWTSRLSPDETRLAIVDRRSESMDLMLVDLGRGTREILEERSIWPWWSDRDHLAFVSYREMPMTIWSRDLSSGAAPTKLAPPPEHGYVVLSMSADPRVAVVYELRPDTGRDIVIVREDGEAETVVGNAGADLGPRLTADARHLLYATDTSGRLEVYVRTCPECRPDLELPARQWRVSVDGGTAPVWSRDESEILYLSGRTMMAAPISFEPEFTVGRPVALFEGDFIPDQFGNPNFDVSRGGRFLMLRSAGGEASRHRIHVVTDWVAEVEERLGEG